MPDMVGIPLSGDGALHAIMGLGSRQRNQDRKIREKARGEFGTQGLDCADGFGLTGVAAPPPSSVVANTQGRDPRGSGFETCSGVWYPGSALEVRQLTPWLI